MWPSWLVLKHTLIVMVVVCLVFCGIGATKQPRRVRVKVSWKRKAFCIWNHWSLTVHNSQPCGKLMFEYQSCFGSLKQISCSKREWKGEIGWPYGTRSLFGWPILWIVLKAFAFNALNYAVIGSVASLLIIRLVVKARSRKPQQNVTSFSKRELLHRLITYVLYHLISNIIFIFYIRIFIIMKMK